MVSVPGAVNRINFFKGDIYVIVESHKNGTVKMRKKMFLKYISQEVNDFLSILITRKLLTSSFCSH